MRNWEITKSRALCPTGRYVVLNYRPGLQPPAYFPQTPSTDHNLNHFSATTIHPSKSAPADCGPATKDSQGDQVKRGRQKSHDRREDHGCDTRMVKKLAGC